MTARPGGRVALVVVFALAHLLLVLLSYSLKESLNAPAVMWPAVGLVFAVLWLTPRSMWPFLLAAQYLVEAFAAALPPEPFDPSTDLFYPLINGFDALVGVLVMRKLVPDASVVRTRTVLHFAGASALGAAAGAPIGAWVILKDSAANMTWLEFLHQSQIWWAGNWLGHLVVVPIVFCWLGPLRRRVPELALRSLTELAIVAVLLVGFTFYIFGHAGRDAASLLQMPMVILGLLIFAALRMPPRWVTVLFAMSAMVCAWFASRSLGPFDHPDVLVRTGGVQTFLAALGVIAFALATSTLEKRIVVGQLRDAEDRYRKFVQFSTEAVWRVEVEPGMPVSLSRDAQQDWLRRHARVVEANRVYAELDPDAQGSDEVAWKPDLPWTKACEARLPVTCRENFSVDGLQFSLEGSGKRRDFVTSFYGVVNGELLVRIWGVARDVSELTEVNERLLREQDRLKTYARQLVTAEERARRSTAVDLHDGIGQTLVGMSMTLDVARQQAPSDVALLVDEVRSRLRLVQDKTRQLITDLSPPGLYELGLMPALQWLTVYMRGHDGLFVELDADVREEWIKLDLRILAFKLVRELLRNVVKHADVSRATVQVRGNDRELRVVVSDKGKGFDSQLDLFGVRAAGFGLWSVADRAQEVGGRFTVETSPGRGSRFELVLPLGVSISDQTGVQQKGRQA